MNMFKRAMKVATAAAGAYAVYRFIRSACDEFGVVEQLSDQLRSRVVDRLGSCPDDELRRAFQARLFESSHRSPAGHSHGKAAAQRTAAQNAIIDFVHTEGLEPYVVSMSARDKDREGYHGYHFSKDVLHPSQSDKVTDKHAIVIIDADYYVDIKKWVRHGRPILMYTFAPNRVAGLVDDGAYTIKGDVVHYRVNGGGRYEHRLWDYSSDQLRVDYPHGSWFCSVEAKQFGEQRQVVCINPYRWVWTPLARIVPGTELTRRKFGVGASTNRSDYITPEGELRVSIGEQGVYTCADMSLRAYTALKIRVAHSKEANVHTVEKYLVNAAETDEEKQAAVYMAPIVYEAVSKDQTIGQVPFTSGGKPASFQVVGKARDGFLVSEEGRRLGRNVAPPLTTNPAVVPVESWNNDVATVRGRVDLPRNVKEPPGIYNTWAKEFLDQLIPDYLAGTGVAWDVGDVIDVQNRPTQRARSEVVRQFMTTKDSEAPIIVSSFMKREAYGGTTDPRNISTTPTSHTLRLSAHTYAFKDAVLKRQPWYSPTNSPTTVADRLTEMAKQNEVLCETDYSRFDGTVSRWQRGFERKAYMRFASHGERPELGRLLNAEHNPPAFTKNGVKYSPGFGRLSGSPLTTDGNTMINAFNSYAAARMSGESREGAWKKLGAYAGDDGCTGVSRFYLEKVAQDMGQKLKCKEVRRGEPLAYLGRVFGDLWTSNGSVQDPIRSAKKLHISFASPEVSDDLALCNRASGYLELDPKAPIVGNWCKKVLALLGPEVAERAKRVVEKCAVDRPYYGSWPQFADEQQAIGVVADAYGVDGSTIQHWCQQIDAAKSLADLRGVVDAPDEDKPVAVRQDSVAALTDSSSSLSGTSPVKPRRIRTQFRCRPKQRRHPADSGRGSSA